MENIIKLWNEALYSAGIHSISTDTSARIMAVLYVHGNNEAFTFNDHFLSDMHYIEERFNLYGTGIPPIEFIELTKKYVKELEAYNEEHKNEQEGCVFSDGKPEWAKKLFFERYKIKI